MSKTPDRWSTKCAVALLAVFGACISVGYAQEYTATKILSFAQSQGEASVAPYSVETISWKGFLVVEADQVKILDGKSNAVFSGEQKDAFMKGKAMPCFSGAFQFFPAPESESSPILLHYDNSNRLASLIYLTQQKVR